MARTMADQTLVKGAYAAAGGNIEGKGLQASQAMTQIGAMIAKPVSKVIQQRHQQFQEFASWELSRNPGLNDAEYEARAEELGQMKSQYLFGDNLTRAKIMREMNEMKVQQEDLNDAKKKYANTIKNNKSFTNKNNKKSQNWMNSEVGQQLTDAMKGSPIWKDGKWGYDVGGQFYGADEINGLIDQLSFDQVSSQKLGTVIIPNVVEQSSLTDPNKKVSFNWTDNYEKMKSQVVNKGTVSSLAYDEIIPGRTFAEDLKNHLASGTYAQLGITQEQATKLDPTPGDQMITEEDAEVIATTLIDNPEYNDIAQHYLSVYYTRYAENQWNAVQNKKQTITDDGWVQTDVTPTILDENAPTWETPKTYWWRED